MAKEDEDVNAACDQLYFAAFNLILAERRIPLLYAESTDPKFIVMWRDYEDRFEKVLSQITLDFLFVSLRGSTLTKIPTESDRWKYLDSAANKQSKAIQRSIDWAYESSRDDLGEFPEGFSVSIEDGAKAWDELKLQVGFDLCGVFRRRSLVPFVLVPRHVANKINRTDSLSMLRKLEQAHNAFIFGVHLAALALMRSIVETVLKTYYGSQGANLAQLIKNARKLPRHANTDALDQLRRLANGVLHEGDEEARLEGDVERLECQMVVLMLVVRSLIEGAPQWPQTAR